MASEDFPNLLAPDGGVLFCPNCQHEVNERDLSTKNRTIESCPTCRTVLREHEGWAMRNRGALVLEDVAAIEAWLSTVAVTEGYTVEKASARESHEKYSWCVPDVRVDRQPILWACELTYDGMNPGTFSIRLVSEEHGPAMLTDAIGPKRLVHVMADHGVQAGGDKYSDAGGCRVRWWAVQVLNTEQLADGLFGAIIKRLDRAMRDATAYFGRIRE